MTNLEIAFAVVAAAAAVLVPGTTAIMWVVGLAGRIETQEKLSDERDKTAAIRHNETLERFDRLEGIVVGRLVDAAGRSDN